jgi:hypothetical protein
MLSEKQNAFLAARKLAPSDAAACREIHISVQSLAKWKKNEEFLTRYTEAIKSELEKELTVPEPDRRQIAIRQIEVVAQVLPETVQTVVDVMRHAPKPADRLKAAAMLFEAIGFKSETMMPVSRQNQVFIQMMKLTASQVAAEADRRGITDVVQGQYEVIEDDEDNEEV